MDTTGSLAVEAKGVSTVRQVPAAASDLALAHFAGKAAFETDCADVHAAFLSGNVDFVLLDVRGRDAFRKGHIAGAISMPRRMINEAAMKAYPDDTFFVVYCDGPHCNGATKAAAELASLGRPVKEMIGGITGWLDDGFSLVEDRQTGVS
jgi:rhodanese-related sulfurtransferase